MSELPKGYAPFNPGPRYKPNPKQIDAQARHILNGGVEKGFSSPRPRTSGQPRCAEQEPS